MLMTLSFASETEARLTALAKARDVSIAELVQRLIEERLEAEPKMSPTIAERRAAWRRVGEGVPLRPPLSDEAISRETMYDRDGE